MRAATILLGAMIVALAGDSVLAAGASVKPPGPSPSPSPSGVSWAPQPQDLFILGKYLGAREILVDGKPGARVAVASPSNVQTAAEVPGDSPLIATLKTLKAGQFVEAEFRDNNGQVTLQSIAAYKPRPGEDEPGMYVLRKRTQVNFNGQDCQAIVVSKLLASGTVLIPMVKDKATGKPVPDDAVLAQVNRFADGELAELLVEPAGQYMWLRGARAYVAPTKGEFVKFTDKKPGEDKFAAVEIKSAGGSETINLPGFMNSLGMMAADRGLAATAGGIQPGQPVEYRTRKDDKGTWLASLRAAGPPPPPATKPADPPKPAK